MDLRRWTIGRKLAALAATGLIFATAIGAVSYVRVGQIHSLSTRSAQLVAADSIVVLKVV